ncbi:MAG TPA: DUF192 domain-containing protein [Vicinamibacterales bacterium]|nr:DUF192 domain-containing protein [Vicinamibacterales bacterium]
MTGAGREGGGVKLAILVAALASAGGTAAQWASPRGEVVFPDRTRVRVEIADTEAKRARGLMFRERLAEQEGMIFLFEKPGFYPFWMQNCLIPLDIIWLDAGGRIVSIAESLPPCRLPGCDPPCGSYECPTYAPAAGTEAIYVVEVAAGFVKRHKVKTGDRLELRGIPGVASAGTPKRRG